MAITINLDSQTESALHRLAQEKNISVEEFARDAVEIAVGGTIFYPAPDIPKFQTGAEMLAYWDSIGALNRTEMTEDSVEYVQRTRQEAESREF